LTLRRRYCSIFCADSNIDWDDIAKFSGRQPF
jgi:hypothetical protein